MQTFEFMGRSLTLSGQGASDSPFVVKGTGYNPSLAAEIEMYIVSKLFSETTWHVVGTRLDSGGGGQSLAVIRVKFHDGNELLQTEVYFDVSEAITRASATKPDAP
jgi:hypothetical protein